MALPIPHTPTITQPRAGVQNWGETIWEISTVYDWYHCVEERLNYGLGPVPSSSDKYFAENEPVLSKLYFSMVQKNATVLFTARLKNMC